MQDQHKSKNTFVDLRFADQIQKLHNSSYTMQNFNDLLQRLTNEDILQQHSGLIDIRKILSLKNNKQSAIDAGFVPKIIEYVKQTEYPQLQLQSLQALSNIASGTSIQCSTIVKSGAIPPFIEVLKIDNLTIIQEAIRPIRNIASDCAKYRDNIIQNGGIVNLVDLIQKNIQKTQFIAIGAWVLSSLCRSKPLTDYLNIKQAIPLLCHLVAKGYISDKQVIPDSCWAISYHINKKLGNIDLLISTGLIPKIVSYITETSFNLVVPCIRILGSLSTGTQIQTEEILNANGINQFCEALNRNNQVIRRQICWVISNITVGSVKQVLLRNYLDRTSFRQLTIQFNVCQKCLKKTMYVDVKFEICYIFINIFGSWKPQKIFQFLKSYSILRYYVDLLNSYDLKTLKISLYYLQKILEFGEKVKKSRQNPLVFEMLGLNAIEILEQLKQLIDDVEDQVHKKANKLLETYFKIKDAVILSYDFDKNLNLSQNSQKMDIQQ